MPAPPSPSPSSAALFSFFQETLHADSVQSSLLSDILRRNSDTEYLRRFRLPPPSDYASPLDSSSSAASLIAYYRRHVPIITHSDIKPYFDRIAAGDSSPILLSRPVHSICLSSGTTSDGQQKYLVLYDEILAASLKLSTISGAFRSRAYPIRSGKKLLDLVFSGKLWKTEGGINVGTATTHLFRSNEFKQKYKSADVTACTPTAVVTASDNREAMYCHLLSALVCREDIEFIHSTFSYTIVEAFATLERRWRNLVDDIRSGILSETAVGEPVVRQAMAPLLRRPDPELADALEAIFRQHEEGGSAAPPLIPLLWPKCKYVLSIMTGAMEPYLPKLQHYAGHLPLVTTDYGASETWIGVNTNPKAAPRDVTFTVVPSFAYFEFLPNDAGEAAEPVGLTEVEVGREYEIIITTYGGLYRYRVGDVVRVAGFYNKSPQLSYVCRKNVVLTVNIDKNTERDLQIAVESGMKRLAEEAGGEVVEMVDFTSYAEMGRGGPGHYVIFMELKKRRKGEVEVKEEALKECAKAMDEAFVDPGYVGSRKVGTIGELELCVVEEGTFAALLDRYLARGVAAITQYKTPRCLATQELRHFMQRRVATSVRSSAYSRLPTPPPPQ